MKKGSVEKSDTLKLIAAYLMDSGISFTYKDGAITVSNAAKKEVADFLIEKGFDEKDLKIE